MSKYKIVILDGSLLDRENYQQALNETDDFEVVASSSDAEDGYKLICENKPDLVVMDIVLGSYDGFELLERLKRENVKCKFLVISALKSDGFIQKAFDLGISYYMLKPAILDLVVKRARAVIKDNLSTRKLIDESAKHDKEIEEKLSNIFLTIGIPAHIKGYQFLREAIKITMTEPEIINSITGELYPSIAKRFSTSASKVERAIRHAIEVAWNRGKIDNINQLFGVNIYTPNDKPTNGEFIALITDKMLFEGASW